jgi:hypothetical protein
MRQASLTGERIKMISPGRYIMATDIRNQNYMNTMDTDSRNQLDERDTRSWLLTWAAVVGIAMLGFAAYFTYEKVGDSMAETDYSRTNPTGTPTQ